MPRTATIQIQLDPDREITIREMDQIQAAANECCSTLEKLGYIRMEVYGDEIKWKRPS